MRRVDSSGDTLSGLIDGSNRRYRTVLPMVMQNVEVFRNGKSQIAELDDGFVIIDARTIEMKEPPLEGDTMAVVYRPVGNTAVFTAPPLAAVSRLVRPGLTQAIVRMPQMPRGLTAHIVCDGTSSKEFTPAWFVCGEDIPPLMPVVVDRYGNIVLAKAGDTERFRVIGISLTEANASGIIRVATSGLVRQCLHNAVPDDPVFLALLGGYTYDAPTQEHSAVVQVGIASSPSDLVISRQIVVVRA